MQRAGVFEQYLSFKEVKMLARAILCCYVVQLAGHAALRFTTTSVLERNIGINKNAQIFKRSPLREDSLVAKDYFKKAT